MNTKTKIGMPTIFKVGIVAVLLIGAAQSGGWFEGVDYGETHEVATRDKSKAESSLLVRGFPVRAAEINMIVLALEDMDEETKSNLRSWHPEPEENIDQDDFEKFRRVLEKPHLLIQLEYFSAVARLLDATNNALMREVYKDLICRYVGKFCAHVEATKITNDGAIYVRDVNFSTKERNSIYAFYRYYAKDLQIDEEILNDTKLNELVNFIVSKGGENAFRSSHHVGRKTWIGFVQSIGKHDAVLADKLFPDWRSY